MMMMMFYQVILALIMRIAFLYIFILALILDIEFRQRSSNVDSQIIVENPSGLHQSTSIKGERCLADSIEQDDLVVVSKSELRAVLDGIAKLNKRLSCLTDINLRLEDLKGIVYTCILFY